MVIPSDVTTPPRKVKKYVGNNLRINLLKNDTALQVTGNNCKVDIEENSGTAKIIGDSCELTVRKGKGAIHYIGNYGKIYLGSNDMAERVKYIGNDGKILSLEVMQEEKEPSEGREKQYDEESDLEKQENQHTKDKVNLEKNQPSDDEEKRHDEGGNLEKRKNQPRKDKKDSEEEKGPPEQAEKQHSEKVQENQRRKVKPSEYCAKVSYSSVSNCKKALSAKKISNLSDCEGKKASSKRSRGQRLCLSIGFNDSFICLRGKEVKTS